VPAGKKSDRHRQAWFGWVLSEAAGGQASVSGAKSDFHQSVEQARFRLTAVGFLRALSDAIDKNTVQRAWGSAKKVDWQGWAERNSWSYQAEAPELAHRWWQDFDGIEEFHHLMTTTLHDLPVTSFQRISHAHMGWGDDAGRTGVYGCVVVRLPAAVAEPYASQPM
jgi:hypothetical protein